MRLFGKKRMTPQDFYTACVKDYHEKAKRLGQCSHDLIFIPELIQMGSRALYWFYTNDDIKGNFSSPMDYYRLAVMFAIDCGIVFAEQWHRDYPGMMRPDYLDTILEEAPFIRAAALAQKDLHMTEDALKNYSTEIFLRWAEMHDGYWDVPNAADYTMKATMAAYQLGVSTILCKFGY